jgi:hypothetical protein
VEHLLTRVEAAEVLAKPTSWLRYSERRKLIPYVKVGQQIRYREADLIAWIQEHTVTSPGARTP